MVSAALLGRLGNWRGELRHAIMLSDAPRVSALFLEFLDGLVEGRLNEAEKERVHAALDKLRGGGTRAATAQLAVDELQQLVYGCYEVLGKSHRQASLLRLHLHHIHHIHHHLARHAHHRHLHRRARRPRSGACPCSCRSGARSTSGRRST